MLKFSDEFALYNEFLINLLYMMNSLANTVYFVGNTPNNIDVTVKVNLSRGITVPYNSMFYSLVPPSGSNRFAFRLSLSLHVFRTARI